MEPKFKTLSEHRAYLHEIVRLKLFFVHLWLEKHPEETFSDVLRKRVDIYRKTEANPGMLNPTVYTFDEEPWISMENAAGEIYKKFIHDRAGFERNAFEVFRASIDARCERDYADPSVLSRYQCGSLRHELQLGDDHETLGFHIANAVQPHSIFDDPEHLRNCFRSLLDIAEKIYGAKKIRTHSWLNSNPKWLALFPDEWKKNLSEPDRNVFWHYGYWGQFISGRGTFNFKLGEILRKTGEFPYYPCASSCTIEAMRRKLEL